MLDSCSQGSLRQEDLIKELQLSGRKTTFNLKTLNIERTESTVLIDGMDVKGVSGNNNMIKLSKMYARTELPVDKEGIATSDKIKQSDYLKVIPSYITQPDGIKVGLLNGANCMKALESLKVMVALMPIKQG